MESWFGFAFWLCRVKVNVTVSKHRKTASAQQLPCGVTNLNKRLYITSLHGDLVWDCI